MYLDKTGVFFWIGSFQLPLGVCDIQIKVLCPYTLEVDITRISYYDLSSTVWSIFTDSSKSAAPFLSCCVPTSNSAPNLLWCSLCVHCSLSLTTKRTHSCQVISKKAVTAESRAAQQKCWAGDCPVKTSGGNTHKCKPDCSFKGEMGGRMEERKRKTFERQARVLSLNRQIVFLKDKLIMFHLCISYT